MNYNFIRELKRVTALMLVVCLLPFADYATALGAQNGNNAGYAEESEGNAAGQEEKSPDGTGTAETSVSGSQAGQPQEVAGTENEGQPGEEVPGQKPDSASGTEESGETENRGSKTEEPAEEAGLEEGALDVIGEPGVEAQIYADLDTQYLDHIRDRQEGNLVVMEDYTLTQDMETDCLYLGEGVLDLNGHSLTVHHDILQEGGILKVGNGSRLTVEGQYLIAKLTVETENAVRLDTCAGILSMQDSGEEYWEEYWESIEKGEERDFGKYVTVEGTFWYDTDAAKTVNENIHDEEGNEIEDYYFLNSGELKLNGNVLIRDGILGSTSISFILGGDKLQLLAIGEENDFGMLELLNESEEGVYSENILHYSSIGRDRYPKPGRLRMKGYEVLNGYQVFDEDMVIQGDCLVSVKTLDLCGHTLVVEGDLIFESGILELSGGKLVIKGDCKKQSISMPEKMEVHSYLYMSQEEDYVLVEGDFHAEILGYGICEGTLEVKGDLYGNTKGFYVGNMHKTILSGTKKQRVVWEEKEGHSNGYDYDYDSIANLTVANTSGEGVEFVGNPRLSGHISINEECKTYGKVIFCNNVSVKNGYYDGDVIFDRDTLYGYATIIDDLTIHGNVLVLNTLRLDADLAVEGNLEYQNGTIEVKDQMLHVKGDFVPKNASDKMDSVNLSMTEEQSRLTVDGDFIFRAWGTQYFNAGALEIGGNVEIMGESYKVSADSRHKVVLNGSGKQTITLPMSPGLVKFGTLEIQNGSQEGVVCEKLPDTEKLITDGRMYFGKYRVIGDKVLVGDVSYGENLIFAGNTYDLNGHHVKVEGDLRIGKGTLSCKKGELSVSGNCIAENESVIDIADGKMNVEGNLELTGNSGLKMQNSGGYLHIVGSMLLSSGRSTSGMMTNGILKVNGDLIQKSAAYFLTSSSHCTILMRKPQSTGKQHISCYSYRSIYFSHLELSEDTEKYYECNEDLDKLSDDITYLLENPTDVAEIRLTSTDVSSVAFTIQPPSGNVTVTGYEIYRDGEKIAKTDKAQYCDTGLEPDREYIYTVYAFDEDGNRSQSSPECRAKTEKDTEAPEKVSGFVVQKRAGASVSLSWDESGDNVSVVGYHLYRDGMLIAEKLETCSYTDQNLEENTVYHYTVTAFDGAGNESGQSEEIETGVLMPVIRAVKPEDFEVIGGSYGEYRKLEVFFADGGYGNQNTVRVEIYNEQSGKWDILTGKMPQTTKVGQGLLKATFMWKLLVSSQDRDVNIRYTLIDVDGKTTSRTVRYELDFAAPKTVTDLQAVDRNMIVKLTWNNAVDSDRQGFYVYRKAESGSKYEKLATIRDKSAVSYEDGTVSEGETYEYKVCPFDAFDHCNTETESVKITVGKDEEAPSIKADFPAFGTYNGTMTLSATATDNKKVAEIIFTVTSESGKTERLYATDTTESGQTYTAKVKWDTTKYPDGCYTVSANAIDMGGNESPMVSQSYLLDNTGPQKAVISDTYVGSTAVNLVWENVSDADVSYYIVEQLINSTWIRQGKYNNLYAELTNLQPGTEYTYRVCAYDRLGNRGEASEEVNVTTSDDITAPFIRQIGPEKERNGEEMKLSMVAEDDAGIDYGRFSYSRDGETFTEVARVEAKVKERRVTLCYDWDTAQLPEGTIIIRYEAYDTAGNHDRTAEGTMVEYQYNIDHTAPQAPEGLVVKEEDGAAVFAWEQNPEKDVCAYRVYRASSADGEFQQIKEVSALFYRDTDTKVRDTFYYKVSAVDEAGNESGKSEVLAVTVKGDETAPEILGFAPMEGAKSGKTVTLKAVVTDNAGLAEVIYEYRAKKSDTWQKIGTVSVSGCDDFAELVWECEEAEENRDYYVRARVSDRAGNEGEPVEHTFRFDLTPPESVSVKAVSESFQIALEYTQCTDEDFDHYEIYRAGNDSDAPFSHIVSTEQTSYTDTEVQAGEAYRYRVCAYDKYGNGSWSKTVIGTADDTDTIAPQANLPETVMGENGSETVFDGLLSTDNVRVAEFLWDFGDGKTSRQARPKHTYEEEGTYPVTLTVWDGSGNKSSAQTQAVIGGKGKTAATTLSVSGLDGKPISGAMVYVKEKELSLQTDSNGQAVISAEEGMYHVVVAAEGYETAEKEVELDGVNGMESIPLMSGSPMVGKIETKQMTLEEIKAAGIDLSDPDNYFYCEYSVKISFLKTPIPTIAVFKGKNEPWENSGGGGRYSSPVVLEGLTEKGTPVKLIADKGRREGGVEFIVIPATVGRISWMKNMYEVKLMLLNASESDAVQLRNISANIHLPDKLSLANTVGGQNSHKMIETLDAGEGTQVCWYVRGDNTGTYLIDSDVSATMMPLQKEVHQKYACTLEVKKQDMEGLHLYIMPENRVYKDENYYVQYKLVNESKETFYQMTTSFGAYQNVRKVLKIKNALGEVKVVDSGIDYYLPSMVASCGLPILSSGDKITVGCFEPGDSICGTFMTRAVGLDDGHYGKLVSTFVKALESNNANISVSVIPVDSHVEVIKLELPAEKNSNGEDGTTEDTEDPINMMNGAFHTEMGVMSVAGVRELLFQMNYNSLYTENPGELGYGWYHDYESRVQKEDGVLDVYVNPNQSIHFIRKSAKEFIVQGEYNDGRVILGKDEKEQEYVPMDEKYEGYQIKEQESGYCLTLPNGSAYEYDEDGILKRIKNLQGQSILISDTEEQLLLTDEATGKYIKATKNTDGRITMLTDPSGEKVILKYTDKGELEAVTNKRGVTNYYTYDKNHHILTGKDTEGKIFLINTYDDKGRVLTQDDGNPDTPLVVLSYNDEEETGQTTITVKNRNGGTQTVIANREGKGKRYTDSIGGITTYEYDIRGNLSRIGYPNGRIEEYTYDEQDNLLAYVDSAGESAAYTYNEYNQLTSKKSNTGDNHAFTYDENHRLTKDVNHRKITEYTYNENGQMLTETVNGQGTTHYTYEAGNLTKITDPTGAVQGFAYDAIGNVVQYTDANGTVTDFEVDANGHVTKQAVTLGDGKKAVTSCTYDAYGNQTSVTDANGNTTTYEYDNEGHPVKQIRADGKEICYTYDVDGNITKITYPDGLAEESAAYDTAGNLLKLKDSLNSVTTQAFLAGGLLEKTVQPNGGEVTYTYYDNGLMETQTDAEGNRTTFTYDAAGRLTGLTDAAGNTNGLAYDKEGNLCSITDGEGNTVKLVYDAFGNITATTDANGNRTSYAYDAAGNCTKQTDALGNVTDYTYDAGGRVTKAVQKDKDGGADHTFAYAYDNLGNITAMTDAEGNTYHIEYDKTGNVTRLYDAKGILNTAYEYDKAYNVTKQTDANGNSTRMDYDAMGNLTRQTNAMGKATAYTYLGARLMNASTDAMGGRVTASYDEMGNLKSFTNPNGGVTAYTYDLNGNVTSESVGDYYRVAYTYDETGNTATKENAKGQKTAYKYDRAQRLASFTDELGTVSYTYDANGNVLTVTETDKNGNRKTTTRTYDALNRVKTYRDADGNTLGYEYDSFGNLKSLTYPEGQKVTYTYNKNNRLVSMTDWNGRTTEYAYDENSLLTETKRPNGTVETRGYDKAGQLVSIVDKKGGTVINSYYYTYDAVGNIVGVSSGEPGGVSDNDIGAEADSGQLPQGVNLTNIKDASMEYDRNNRLIKYNGQEVKYDKDGNMTYGPLSGEMAEYTYDCRNRLVKAETVFGEITEYEYDAEDNRTGVRKHAGTGDEVYIKYVVDSGSGDLTQIVRSVETDKGGNEKTLYYFYGNNRLTAQEEYKKGEGKPANRKEDTGEKTKESVEGSAVTMQAVEGTYLTYHFNNVGSTTSVTDGDGNVKYQYDYSPYGDLIKGSYGEVLFLYNGQYGVASDDNGLYYMRARYYNVDIKRFINQDVLTGDIDSSPSLNRYAYVEGNPVSYIDPFGLEAQDNSDIHLVWIIAKCLMVQKLTNGGTVSVGGAFSYAGGAAISGSAGVTLDCYGNVTTGLSLAAGGGLPSWGLGVYFTETNAPSAASIGTTGGTGIGIGAGGVSIAIDVLTIANKSSRAKKGYTGTTIFIGGGGGPCFIEMHGNATIVSKDKFRFNVITGK